MKYFDKSTLNAIALAALVSICIRLFAGDGLDAFVYTGLTVSVVTLFVMTVYKIQGRYIQSDGDGNYYSGLMISKELYKKGETEEAMQILRELLHLHDGKDYHQDHYHGGKPNSTDGDG